ncbi:unnamed protein product [Ceratitis capitata]|uniref:(Mediterranean fruit fly) hypothetical protein n=1 Tax=Ceratitis capitata TaxID=7213 RepID=A0A811V2E9_CERCA|nr:unnamed protein product [Ceratitis capitata]
MNKKNRQNLQQTQQKQPAKAFKRGKNSKNAKRSEETNSGRAVERWSGDHQHSRLVCVASRASRSGCVRRSSSAPAKLETFNSAATAKAVEQVAPILATFGSFVFVMFDLSCRAAGASVASEKNSEVCV